MEIVNLAVEIYTADAREEEKPKFKDCLVEAESIHQEIQRYMHETPDMKEGKLDG